MSVYTSDGLSLYYEVHGTGRPVVLLHGAAVTFAVNYGFGWVERLTGRGFQVIGVDFRGHGTCDKPRDSSAYGSDPFAGDVVALLDHLGIDRAALVGYSIGSQVALHALHTFPDRFDAGGLVASGDGLVGLSPVTFPAILPALAETCRRPEFPDDLPPQMATYWTFATQVAGDREAIVHFAEGDFPACSVDEAGSIDVPVLVVSGDQDNVLGTGANLAASLPKGRYVEIPGADHFSLAVDETVQSAVADFLAG